MRRREPPPLATWMLRHLTAGYRDEALDGDLLEVYRLGRSTGWYWRQVSATCVLSWFRSLCDRGPVLVFALVWSMLSPAWYAVTDLLESSSVLDKASQMFEPVWLPLVVIGWVAIHALFFWVGLLIYRLVHKVLQKPLLSGDLRLAFRIAPVVFPFISGLTSLIANLYWYSIPGLAQAKLAPSVMGQVSDLSILAAFIRFPYFITMLAALWMTVREIRKEDVETSFINPTKNMI